MACCKGSSSIAAILGVVGVVAVGIGGFNFVRTGCPLGIYGGACESTVTTVSETAVKSESTDSTCCSTGAEKAVEDCCGLCPEGAAKKAAVTEAALSTAPAEAKTCESKAKSCGKETSCESTPEAAPSAETTAQTPATPAPTAPATAG